MIHWMMYNRNVIVRNNLLTDLDLVKNYLFETFSFVNVCILCLHVLVEIVQRLIDLTYAIPEPDIMNTTDVGYYFFINY